MFLDLFEAECADMKRKPLNISYLTMDASVLLPPIGTPMSGVEFPKRLPCGDVERARRTVRVFLSLRSLHLAVKNDIETVLPLASPQTGIKEGEILDLSMLLQSLNRPCYCMNILSYFILYSALTILILELLRDHECTILNNVYAILNFNETLLKIFKYQYKDINFILFLGFYGSFCLFLFDFSVPFYIISITHHYFLLFLPTFAVLFQVLYYCTKISLTIAKNCNFEKFHFLVHCRGIGLNKRGRKCT